MTTGRIPHTLKTLGYWKKSMCELVGQRGWDTEDDPNVTAWERGLQPASVAPAEALEVLADVCRRLLFSPVGSDEEAALLEELGWVMATVVDGRRSAQEAWDLATRKRPAPGWLRTVAGRLLQAVSRQPGYAWWGRGQAAKGRAQDFT